MDLSRLVPDPSLPFDHAYAAGYAADRLGFAFAGGYRAALRALIGTQMPPADLARVVALCATEAKGNHPRAIETRLTGEELGRYSLSGKKTWATFAEDIAEPLLLVVATLGDTNGRPELKLVTVDAGAPGVTIEKTSAPFVPEIPHATVTFDRVDIVAGAFLAGDGYVEYLKPFRTVEDLHVHAALLGYLIGVVRRRSLGTAMIDRLTALAHAARSIAQLSPKAAETHVALGGLLDLVTRVVEEVEDAWSGLPPDDEWARWQRDRPLLSVAGKARIARREKAWESLA